MAIMPPWYISTQPSALNLSVQVQKAAWLCGSTLCAANYWYTTSVPSSILGSGIPYTVVAWVYFYNFYNSSCYSTGGSWGENYVFYLGHTAQGTDSGGSTFRGVVFPFSSTYGYLGVDESYGANYSSAVPVYAGQWVFLWWQYPGSGTTFYVGAIYPNGTQYSGSIGLGYSLNVSASNYPAFFLNTIGFSPGPNSCNSNGWIAYLAFYNVALSSSQIYAIYQGIRITSNLVMEYWGNNYNPSTGVFNDSSGNNVNLNPGKTPYPNRGCVVWPPIYAGNWPVWTPC